MPDNPFEAIASAFFNPQVNPNAVGVDKDGRIVDASGKQVDLYKRPWVFERMFNPDAQRIQMLNTEAQNRPLTSQQDAVTAEIARRTAMANRAEGLPPGMINNASGANFTPEQIANMYSTGDFRPSNIGQEGRAFRNIVGNLPQTLSNTDINTAQAGLDESTEFNRLGGGTNTGAHRALAANFGANEASFANKLLPLRYDVDNATLDNQLFNQTDIVKPIQSREAVRIPDEQTTKDLTTADSLAGARQLPSTLQYRLQSNLLTSMKDAAFAGVAPQMPAIGNRVTMNGIMTPFTNPDYKSEQDLAWDKLQTAAGIPNTTVVPGGTIVLPDKSDKSSSILESNQGEKTEKKTKKKTPPPPKRPLVAAPPAREWEGAIPAVVRGFINNPASRRVGRYGYNTQAELQNLVRKLAHQKGSVDVPYAP